MTDVPLEREFLWRDGERTIVFHVGAFADAAKLLAEHGWERWELLTTSRSLVGAPAELPDAASALHEVPAGRVDEIAAELVDRVEADALVALGGGRVIDTAKAIAAVRGARVAAIPTTLSGAPVTPFHRLPAGREADAKSLVRPALVIGDPESMTTQPEEELRASAMNALAHGAESLYTPLSNPVATMAALRGAGLIATSLDEGREGRDRAGLALGALLCGYAVGSTFFAVHHVVCQTLVRGLGTPHAETNAAMLPRTMEMMRSRAPRQIDALADALATDAAGIGRRIEALGGGRRSLGGLGADRERLDDALDAIMARGELGATPGGAPSRDDIAELLEAAW